MRGKARRGGNGGKEREYGIEKRGEGRRVD